MDMLEFLYSILCAWKLKIFCRQGAFIYSKYDVGCEVCLSEMFDMIVLWQCCTDQRESGMLQLLNWCDTGAVWAVISLSVSAQVSPRISLVSSLSSATTFSTSTHLNYQLFDKTICNFLTSNTPESTDVVFSNILLLWPVKVSTNFLVSVSQQWLIIALAFKANHHWKSG